MFGRDDSGHHTAENDEDRAGGRQVHHPYAAGRRGGDGGVRPHPCGTPCPWHHAGGGLQATERNPKDGRSQLLYATEKAERLKNSKTQVETLFYEWLLEPLGKKERREFVRVLELLYQRSKAESRAGFPNVAERIKGEDRNEE